ncbi:MAG: hypothetical protein JXQ68_05780, partial [Campylobacterales bacterium]|nr:hypothetical protein [Campylobacterales bacterium]
MRLLKIMIISIVIGIVGGTADEFILGQTDEQSIEQKIETKDGYVSITVPLREKKGLQYEGIHLCKPAGSEDDM